MPLKILLVLSKTMYCEKYNIEFYNIPKCGMTSVVNSINFKWSQIDTLPENRAVFTIIRNPVDRCISSYLHIKRYKNFSHRQPVDKNIFSGPTLISFDKYLTELEKYGFLDSHDLPQMYFIDGVTSKMIKIPRKFENVDVFILFENMQNELNKLINDKIKLKKLNINTSVEKQQLKNNLSKFESRIIKLYRKDFELYNKIKDENNSTQR